MCLIHAGGLRSLNTPDLRIHTLWVHVDLFLNANYEKKLYSCHRKPSIDHKIGDECCDHLKGLMWGQEYARPLRTANVLHVSEITLFDFNITYVVLT